VSDNKPAWAPVEKWNGPLAEAESALKKLRANAQDKQALDALDRALQRLKQRQQQRHAPQDATAPEKPPRQN
jgi:hypothetical protein